jgi:N-acetyl-gamma-glutamyl-phosphate reductase
MHADFVFIPQRGSFTRGIFATTLVETDQSLEKLVYIYTDFYAESKFTFLVQDNIDLKMVINTNKCLIQLKKHNNHLLITSIIDNLIKGAAGQAVHNMNLMFGLDEQTGLKLKSSIY